MLFFDDFDETKIVKIFVVDFDETKMIKIFVVDFQKFTNKHISIIFI